MNRRRVRALCARLPRSMAAGDATIEQSPTNQSQSSCCQRHPSRAWIDNIGNIDKLRTPGSLGAWRTTGSRDGVANAAIRQDAGRCEVHRPRQSRQGTRCDEAKANVDVGGWRRCVNLGLWLRRPLQQQQQQAQCQWTCTPVKWRRLDSWACQAPHGQGWHMGTRFGWERKSEAESELVCFPQRIKAWRSKLRVTG